MIALYSRVSTQEQAVNGHSITEQGSRLEAFCRAHGWEDFKHFTDAGFSGGSLKRPALQELIDAVEQHKICRIIVYKLDRLSRSQKDTLHLIEDVFIKNGTDFISISENFDTASAFGRAMIGMLAVFAQLERDQIKERMELGRTARSKLGNFHGSGNIPIGYDYDGALHINQYEAGLVRTVYEKAAAGVPIRRIASDMNSAGLLHKYGEWNTTTIRKMLSRRTYLGEVCFKGMWYPAKHPPIIQKGLFDAVQLINATRKEKALKENVRLGRASSLLAGLVYCSRCGARYTAQVYNHGAHHYERYACASRSKRNRELIIDPSCKNTSWSRSDLEDLVFDQIRRLSFEHRETSKAPKPEPKSARLARIEDSIKRLVDLYSVGNIQLPAITEKIEELMAQKEKLLKYQEPDLTPEKAASLAEHLDAVLDNGTFDEKRAILTTLIDRIEIDGEDVTIRWAFTL